MLIRLGPRAVGTVIRAGGDDLQAPIPAAPVAIGPVGSGTVVATVVGPLCAYPNITETVDFIGAPWGLEPLFSP